MHEPVVVTGKWLKSVVQGYFNYHAVPGNTDILRVFRCRVTRDHPAGGRLGRHSEPRVGGAAGCTTWLLYYRSREVISVTYTGRRRGTPARRLATALAVV
jgi:hypothetical protein